VDVFGSPYATHMPLANLVPHSPANSTLYFDAVSWATLGIKDKEEGGPKGQVRPKPPEWETAHKAIHGATESSTSSTTRLPGTGIKHSAPNVIRLYGRAEYFDAHPGLIIVPILTLGKVKGWKGEPYHALAMAGEVWEQVEGQGFAVTSDFPTVCKRIGMTTKNGREASPDEIETGRTLLTSVLLGIAYSLVERSPHRERHLTEDQRTKLAGYRATFSAADADKVLVPVPNPAPPAAPVRVRVVEFGPATGAPAEASASEGKEEKPIAAVADRRRLLLPLRVENGPPSLLSCR
jgi:hypothetical protein